MYGLPPRWFTQRTLAVAARKVRWPRTVPGLCATATRTAPVALTEPTVALVMRCLAAVADAHPGAAADDLATLALRRRAAAPGVIAAISELSRRGWTLPALTALDAPALLALLAAAVPS